MSPFLPVMLNQNRPALTAGQRDGCYTDVCYLRKICQYLASVRASRSLSRKRLADRAGISHRAVCRAERDFVIPNSSELDSWAAALDLRMEDVWTTCLPGPFYRTESSGPDLRKSLVA